MRSSFAPWRSVIGLALPVLVVLVLTSPSPADAQQGAAAVGEVVFTRDIAPILQRSCDAVIGPVVWRRCPSSSTTT